MISAQIACLWLVCFASQARVADSPKAPDLGFDYKAMILQHVQAVVDGKGDRALEILDTRATSKDWFRPNARETCKKHYAKIYGANSKCLDSEVVGYKKVTSRIVRVYAVSHYEQFAITYSFTFLKSSEGEWRLYAYSLTEGIEDVEKLLPLVPIVKASD